MAHRRMKVEQEVAETSRRKLVVQRAIPGRSELTGLEVAQSESREAFARQVGAAIELQALRVVPLTIPLLQVASHIGNIGYGSRLEADFQVIVVGPHHDSGTRRGARHQSANVLGHVARTD